MVSRLIWEAPVEMALRAFFREWRELNRFGALSPDDRSIVFYAEDASSWKHFEPIISELTGSFDKRICYVTSSSDDPVLQGRDDQIRTFYVGFGSARTAMFRSLDAGVMGMTMPDLESFHIKRSRHPVHYVYVYHSMVSTHMIYRLGAFDHFDTILCVGPHQREEIRANEALYGLRPKVLVDAGYPLLDSILDSSKPEAETKPLPSSTPKRVLVAPSWDKNAILENCGTDLVEVLLAAGHHVTVRPHMMTIRNNSKFLAALYDRFNSRPNFTLDLRTASQGSVGASDLMISDWSGAALEYAFGLERPVLYIDVPRKVNNPEYERIPCVPIEVKLRPEIEAIVQPDRLEEVPERVEELCGNPAAWREKIRELRSRWVYNVGASGKVGAAYIAQASETPGALERQEAESGTAR